MLHEPAAPSGKDPASEFKKTLGIWMCLFYGLIYAGFVALNLISPTAMEKEVFMGMNLAVVYGIGLIVFALILALIYNALCGSKEAELAEKETGKEE